MSAIQPIAFLDAVAGYVTSSSSSSADRPIKLATIDPAYSAFSGLYPSGVNPARVTFDGESTLSAKAYPIASGYIPQPGNRVYLVPIGNTYLIVGTISNLAAQGFYSSASDTGVEFGAGNYFDTTEGLVLSTDADIAGDISVGGDLNVDGVGAFLYKMQGGDGPSVANNATTFQSPSTLFLDLPVGVWETHLSIAYTTVAGDIQGRWAFTGTWSGGKYVQGISPFAAATSTVTDANSRDSAPSRNGWHGVTTAIPYGGNDSANYAGAHEWGIQTVTVAGRWTYEYCQRVSAGAQAMVRGPSYMTARRVG